ncbi:hypothetical protein LEP1GSC202_3893 [Leptospira yanagawae serovar Saopaulo str. Sao Paulo = ATCC 700523]|uniref:Uncharacterized protein n=1 Tax=Leptospira yanagawae serovar Saopaulo str. Sao Paulo = ATCC 700523 TaxID=1249483 RepID=A0A5E8HHP4_9LEPT|nr:hypothetical protein LEP1GSC202_3893 [Leptospira yanagawae serovar Saopaulo str. Sao Paulo = ATCC 700523]
MSLTRENAYLFHTSSSIEILGHILEKGKFSFYSNFISFSLLSSLPE